MSEQTLKFGNVVINKKQFHASKQAIALNLVDINKIYILLAMYMMMILLLNLCVLYHLK